MKIINSTTNTSSEANTGYIAVFEGGDGDKNISISEPRLSSEEAARARAYAELIDSGYEATSVDISTPFDAKLELNSTVRVTALTKGIPRKLGAERFIIKEIEIKGDAKTIIMDIKGERYD